MDKFIGFVRRFLSMIAITLSILCILLTISELFVYLMDQASGVDNYVDWTRSIIAPAVMFGVFGAIALLLNLDRFIKRRGPPKKADMKLELPDLD